MNKLFKHLAASALGIALAVGVGVGVSSAVKTNEVNAANQTISLKNIGASLGSSANTTLEIVDIEETEGKGDTYTLNYLQCKKQNSSMLLTKSVGAFVSNKTAIPGNIKSVTVYINSGASAKTTYYCGFSTTECTSAYTTGCTAVNIVGGANHTFDCTVANAKYFCVSLGNANNGQVLSLDVTYDDGQAAKSVTGVTMDEKTVTVLTGNTRQLSATIAPADATNKNVTWASDKTSIATVDENGLVTAVSTGNATITVTTEDGGFTDTCDVTVNENPYKVDKLNVTTLGFPSNYGDTEEKTISCSASYMANGTIDGGVNMQMRSNNSNSGIVTLKTGGLLKTATVNVGRGTATWQILGNNNAYTSPTNLYGSGDVKGTVLTSSSTSDTYEFESDYQYFGFRSQSGAIYIESIVLEWEPVKPTSITADNSIELTLGGKSQIEYELVNEDGYIVSETGVTFSSSNPCVTVSETGLVEGVSAGEAVVTITSNADETVKKEIPVTVSAQKINVESVTLNVHELELPETHGEQLTYTLLPVDASVQDVTWSSDDEGVATVNQDGNVLAISKGTATIKVESDDDPTKYDECVVTVVEREKVYFELVDDASKLVNSAQYVVAGVKDEVINVMGHYKTNDNNIKSAGQLFVDEDSHVYGIREDAESLYYTLNQDAEGYWTMFDGAKYLYAAGGLNDKNNYLKAKDEIVDTSKWDITFNDGYINIAARGEVTNNNMRYNSGNDLFSCYGYDEDGNPKQSQLYLYRVLHTAETAESYAEYFLEDTNAICLTGTDNYEALNAKWATYAANYNALDAGEKAKFLVETPTVVIKNMLDRYDYVVVKYNLTPFIDGHVITLTNPYMSLVSNNNQTMVVAIISVAVASISLLGVTIFLKKRRAVR